MQGRTTRPHGTDLLRDSLYSSEPAADVAAGQVASCFAARFRERGVPIVDGPLDFRNQIVVVTGAATGLGYAIAEAFGRAGASVAINDLTAARVGLACKRLTQQGITCVGHPADVRDAGAVAGFFDRVRQDLGVPDIVVANAGLYPNTPFLDLSEAEWDRVMNTNVKGVFLVCQAAA